MFWFRSSKYFGSRKHWSDGHFISVPALSVPSGFQVATNSGKTTFAHCPCAFGFFIFLNIKFLTKPMKLLNLLKLSILAEQYVTGWRNSTRPSLPFLSPFPLETPDALIKNGWVHPQHMTAGKYSHPQVFWERASCAAQEDGFGSSSQRARASRTRAAGTVRRARATNQLRFLSTGF